MKQTALRNMMLHKSLLLRALCLVWLFSIYVQMKPHFAIFSIKAKKNYVVCTLCTIIID